jgi:glycosyltransferase involved in cell wall biosynthesis
MPATILHINTESTWRGGEAQTLLLARGLRDRGHRCLVAGQPGSPLVRRATGSDLPTAPVAMRGELHLTAARRLAHVVREEGVDLLHYHTAHAVTLGTLASLICGRRPAVAARRLSFPLRNRIMGRFKYSFRVDRVIAVSEAIRRRLVAQGLDPRRVEVIHSGIQMERFVFSGTSRFRASLGGGALGIRGGSFLIGTAGYLAPEKGFDLFIEAAALAIPELPDAIFAIIGGGGEEDALRRLAERRRILNRVLFAGFRDDMPDVFGGLDLFVLPSNVAEGSPAVLKEAMASGVPLVATALDGVDEIVEDGRHALLVPPGDVPALARAIVLMAADKALRTRLVEAARSKICEFTAERMVERTEAVYYALGVAS